MKTELTERGDGRRAIAICADWSEVAADYDDLSASYARRALPGFRPGKAPRAVIEQRFRQELRDDFTARCGLRLARQALRERDLRPAGPIAVGQVRFEPRREFSFEAEFVPSPVFELPDYAAAPFAGETDDERRDELSEWLLSQTLGDPPAALIRQECDRMRDPDAEPGGEAWRAAARRVKLTAILAQIAEAEGIETDKHDVDARIEKVAAENGVRPEELRRTLDREDGLTSLRSLLLAEQTLNYLIEGPTRAGSRAERRLPDRRIARERGKARSGRIRKRQPDSNRRSP